jgi:hypothetical protein
LENLPTEFEGLPTKKKKTLNLQPTGIPDIPSNNVAPPAVTGDNTIDNSASFSQNHTHDVMTDQYNLNDLFIQENDQLVNFEENPYQQKHIQNTGRLTMVKKDQDIISTPENTFVQTDERGNVLNHNSKNIQFVDDDFWVDPLLQKDASPIFGDTKHFHFNSSFHGTTPKRARQTVIHSLKNRFKNHLTLETLSNELRRDPYYKDLFNYLKYNVLPKTKNKVNSVLNMADNFCLINDILFKIPELKKETSLLGEKLKLVVPSTLGRYIIRLHHNNPLLGGHRKFSKTLSLINKNYYMNGLAKLLKLYLETCHVCQKMSKSKDSKTRIPLGISSAKFSSEPCQWLQFDFMNLNMQTQSFNYALLVQDEFSNYLFSFACKNADAKTAAICISQIFDTYGHPKYLTSDRGTHFLNQLDTELEKIYGYSHIFDASKNPQGSGLVEKSVDSIKVLISHSLAGNPHMNIKKCLENATISYNVTPNDSLDGLTPFYCFFKRDYNTPLDTALLTDNIVYEPTHVVAKDIKNNILLKNSLIKKAHILLKQKRKHDNDLNIEKMATFSAGDEVFLEDLSNPLNAKLGRKKKVLKTGPYVVVYVVKNLAILADKNGDIKPDLISIRRLIPVSNIDNSMKCDTINTLVEKVVKTERKRLKNDGVQNLFYPVIDGIVQKQSAFWF